MTILMGLSALYRSFCPSVHPSVVTVSWLSAPIALRSTCNLMCDLLDVLLGILDVNDVEDLHLPLRVDGLHHNLPQRLSISRFSSLLEVV